MRRALGRDCTSSARGRRIRKGPPAVPQAGRPRSARSGRRRGPSEHGPFRVRSPRPLWSEHVSRVRTTCSPRARRPVRALPACAGALRPGGLHCAAMLDVGRIVVAIVWSLLLGLIIAVGGLAVFGGFAKGKWY